MGADHSRWLQCQNAAPCESRLFEGSPDSPLDGSRERFVEEAEVEAEEATTGARKAGEDQGSDLSVKFEYVCKSFGGGPPSGDLGKLYQAAEDLARDDPPTSWLSQESHYSNGLLCSKFKKARNSSFSSLSGAALSANATLANTKVCNNMIGGVVLPVLDSPRYFRRLVTFPSSLSSSSSDGSSTHSRLSSSLSPSSKSSGYLNAEDSSLKNSLSNSAPDSSSLLYGQEIQTAGGAAGEDRVQAVCSEENGLLFCGIYDGFNGRDAADYLAAHLYEKIGLQLRLLDLQLTTASNGEGYALSAPPSSAESDSYLLQHPMSASPECPADTCCWKQGAAPGSGNAGGRLSNDDVAFQRLITKGLKKALRETEVDFFDIVEQEMDDRPEIAMVGSCVLATLIHGQDLFTVNLGDSRAILASESRESDSLCATSLSEIHNLENPSEKNRVYCEHPEDPSAVVGVRVKGKLRVTRAFGAGFLKSALYNDGLLGILRVRNLQSPPYISSTPYVHAHRIRPEDRFVVAASDGLFDFFSNQEVVDLVWNFMSQNPGGDSASYMLDLLLQRAAVNACMTVEELKNVPSGRRRQYHDDVTIVIITLGDSPRTNSATLS